MRGSLIVAFVCVFFLVQTNSVSAIFYNNSEVIEIGDGLPPEPSEEEGVGGTSGEGEGGAGDTGGGDTGGSSTGGSGTGSSGGSSGTSGNGSSESGSSSGSSSSTGGESSTPGSGSGDVTEDDVIETLIESGALSGIDSGSLGSVSGSGAGSGGSGSTAGSGGSIGGSLNVRIVGAKVRSALQGNLDLKELLQYWKRGTSGGSATAREYGLIAASTALRDSNVQEVSFTASKFEIVYRSRGYLLAIIPWSFPVRVAVVPEAASSADRVQVRLPWYRFFVRKFFTASGLVRDVDAVVQKAKADNADLDVDGKAVVFDAVSIFLKKKVGTIEDSLILGIPAS